MTERRPSVSRSARRAVALALVLSAVAGGAGAAEPAAIVEEVGGGLRQPAMMDYVEAGRAIDLGAGGTLVLGYLRSCLRESISGGRVTVGREQSVVEGGRLRRERVECDGGRMLPADAQSDKGAVMVLRRVPDGGPATQPSLRIFSLSPVVRTGNGATTLTIERLDRPAPAVTVALGAAAVDLARQRVALKAGGLYRATAGDRQVVFAVDALADRADGPLVGRLIHF